ncbi:outer membrane protein assembly factor BamB family protein [Cohnella fermenti]|uniref:Pyrrolo-quinoline quinone n=1 Tax=Cohnella fermenti TaxID=2565925 RepID=A0A4S4BWH9_9BACL|nr:PQQ-binding-like beta-propeller repeat protein [Cohnella fermenti]THF79533.1 pyrrolo-quinoline quinone [Cohnella fermenti]
MIRLRPYLTALIILFAISELIGNASGHTASAANAANAATSRIQYRWSSIPQPQAFPSVYTEVDGVLTFRGSAERSAPAYGTVEMKTFTPLKAWSLTTKTSSWGGGAGWTGQPAIVRWEPDVLQAMNVQDKFKKLKDFTEVIYASLDGYVYFLELKTGEKTREPLKIGNPIKGSVSVDSRGYPLLYVGEGIPEKGTIGFGLYSLIDQKRLYYMKGIDSFAKRGWGAFDSSALFNRFDDTLLVGGENGMFYNVKLNTAFDAAKKTLTIKPEVSKYRYSIAGNSYQGIENSVAVYGHYAYFADNGGSLQAINLMTNTPIWSLPSVDDTDATIVIETENGVPYLYTGTEVDKQGSKGYAVLRKINGLTGDVVWKKQYACYTQLGDHPVNGGLLATPVLGKQAIADRVVFTLARYGSFGAGLMVALDKKTGDELWSWKMQRYAWSSPVDVYDSKGNASLLQADSAGNVFVVSAMTGQVKGKASLGANVEASPAVFDDYAVVASRGGKIFGLKLE